MCMGVSLKVCMQVPWHDEVVYVNLRKQQLKCFPYMVHSSNSSASVNIRSVNELWGH